MCMCCVCIHIKPFMGLNTSISQDDLLPSSNITFFRFVYAISKTICLVRKVNMSGYKLKLMLFFLFYLF